MRLHKNIKIFLNYFLGPALFIWLSVSIYRQVVQQPNLELSWQKIQNSLQSPEILLLIVVALLMLLNWGIEAWKWKISISPIQYVSFRTAFRAVLSGVSFSVTTPNRIGEYLGRILYMKEGNRMRAISTTIVGSMSQLIITILAGLLGVLFLSGRLEKELDSVLAVRLLVMAIGIVLVILTVIYFRLSWLARWVDRLPGSRHYAYLVKAVEEFNATLLWRLLSLSAVRYLVFIIQYYLVFRLFGVDLNPAEAMVAMSVVFLVMAFIPTIALVELGLRGEVSLQILGLYSANDLGIGLSAATIWFINLVVPAIAGSLLILSIRIFRKQKAEGE